MSRRRHAVAVCALVTLHVALALAVGSHQRVALPKTELAAAVQETTVTNNSVTLTLFGSTNISIQAGQQTFSEPGYSCIDSNQNADSSVAVSVGPANASLSNFSLSLGQYVLTYTCVGPITSSVVTITRSVRVIDQSAPAIALLGSTNITLFKGQDWTEPGYYALDSFDGNVTGRVTIQYALHSFASWDYFDSLDTTLPGSYFIFYNVRDSAGNVASTANRTVTVLYSTGGCNQDDNGAVTTAFLGVVVFIVAAMLLSNLIRQQGLVIWADPNVDPGFIHQSFGLEDETTRVLDYDA